MSNTVEHLNLRIAAPPVSVAAQLETTVVPLVVIGLVLLLLIVLVLFWRMGRKPQAAPPPPAEKPAEPSASIVVPPPPPAPPTSASLEFVAESGQMVLTLEKPIVTIGRALDNDIVVTTAILNADTVSQHHVRVRRDQDGYVVRDLGSKNGLAVNGRQTIENLLQDGDRLRFGEAEAIFHQPAGGAA